MSALLRDSPTAPLTDAELVERILGGDQAAFAPLMRRYNRVLFRTARSILRNDADAEDVLQNAYLRAYRTLPGFRGEAALSTWLTRIVINEALMRLRTATRRANIVQLHTMEHDQSDLHEPRASGDDEPLAAAMRAQTRRLLERAIDALPESFRTVFVLRAVEDMSVEEVAAVLGIPEATVRTRHFRGRGMLRDALLREVDFAMEDAFSFDGARCDRIVDGVLARLSAATVR